jgi:tetratricopeptide (TPR) repeat protein
MATVYQRQNKLKEAEDEMRKAYQADENYIIALGNFYIQQKQFDKAFQVYESALQKNQDDVRAIYQVGKISAVSGQRLDYGEQCLKRYLIYQPKPAEPSHAAAYMRLGQIKERGGNKTEARTNYEKALALDNSLKEAKEGLARVK